MTTSGEFELDILSQAVSTTPSVETPSETLKVLSSLEEMRSAVTTVAAGAQRLMSIYTPDLEPELYDQTPFLEIVKRFVLARSFAKVRVLLGDSTRLLREGNRFVAMGRRLTSYIDIRVIQSPARQRATAYLIADDKAIVYRLRTDEWNGIADFHNPAVARLHLVEFDELWNANAPDHQLRTAYR